MQFILNLKINGYQLLGIPWNVFLAVIPCFIAYYMAKAIGRKKWKQLKGQQLAFILLFLIWLLMLPNTAYLFTIVRHLVDYCSDYDKWRVCADGSWLVMFFFTYAAIGLPTFYYSIKKMGRIFEVVFNKTSSKIFPAIAIPLTTIGVMFGLYSRYNSWDIFIKPCDILRTAGTYFTESYLLTDFIVFTICLYFIYYLTGHLLKK